MGSAAEWRSIPLRRAGRYIYVRRDPGRERGAVLEFDPTTKRESLVLDLDRVGGDENLVPDSWATSRDGRYMVFRLSPNGSDAFEARVFDVRNRTWLSDSIRDVRYAYPVWHPRSTGFFYTRSPAEPGLSPEKRTALSDIRFHTIGTNSRNDEQLREPPNVDGAIDVPDVSPDGRWLIDVRWFGTTRNTLFLRDALIPNGVWRQVTPDDSALYHCTFSKDALLIWTEKGAPHSHLFRAPLAHPERANWVEIVPENPNAFLDDVNVIGSYFVLTYRQDAERRFELRSAEGKALGVLRSPDVGALRSVVGEPWLDEGAAVSGSYTDPYVPYLVHPERLDIRRFPTAPPVRSLAPYTVDKVFYTSPDGTRAPIFVVRAKTTPPSSHAPLILRAYGAYGFNTEPGYRPGLETWLERGGVYAEAVIRGGGEYGEKWHADGMAKNRVNNYADFIAAAEHLIREGHTDPTRLVIRGASVGGLLVSVAMTERPDLFAGVISEDPLTDMVRYERGGNGPLWGAELGSAAKADEFPILLRYSPYHRVRAGAHYPWLLVMSSAEDDRVDPMHARKFAAAVRAADPSNTVLLRTEPKAAHGGANTRSAWLEAEADVYAFAFAAIAAHSLHAEK
jgi:prolyl oligopeptidase